ncbi:MAG: M16 family metallopeptidase, partial [Candidatus Aminicenantales bacterium]
MRFATSLVYQNLFKDHPYERPIYGKEEVIQTATVDQVLEFHRKYFVPANAALAVVGDIDTAELKKKIQAAFRDLQNNGFQPTAFERVRPLRKSVEIVQEMDVNVGYLVIGTNGPDYNHQDQYAVDVLTEVLGRGIVPVLSYPLRGRRKLAETIAMSYGAYMYGGMITIYLTMEPGRMKAAKRETLNFLKRTRNLNFSKSDYPGEQRF